MSWFNVFLKQDARHFRQGEVLFETGDGAECMYVVAEGEVEISVGGRW
jgi:CRP-like cAMP-binding protein